MTRTLLSLSIATVFSLLFADVAFAYRPTEWLGSGDEGSSEGFIKYTLMAYGLAVLVQWWWDKRLDLCMTFHEKLGYAFWWTPLTAPVLWFFIELFSV